MLTDAQRDLIHWYYPGSHPRDILRRAIVTALADADGELSADALARAVGIATLNLSALTAGWLGVVSIRTAGQSGYQLARGLREQLGLVPQVDHLAISRILGSEPVPLTERARCEIQVQQARGAEAALKQATPSGWDRLADVRAAVAHARNVSTVQEALAHAYGTTVVEIPDFIPPRDCPGVEI